MSNLKQKTINGMAWSVTERISLQVIQILTSIILARLLDPAEFGLLGMLAIFTSIAQSLLDSGFGSALIQKKDADQTDSSSIFYFNLFIGVVLAGIFFFSAPLIANFYEQPILTSITRVLSLNLIINAFSVVQLSLLRKKMDFRNHFITNFVAVIFAGVCGIVSAAFGLGVWSLVIQTLSLSLAKASALWILNNWRPNGNFSLTSLRTMFSFGSNLLFSDLLETVFKNLYQTFIGKAYLPSNVGYYTQATTYESAATITTSMALGQVIFPAFSPYQDDNAKLQLMHIKTIKMSIFLHFPLMIGLIVIAKPLFLFLLTDKWADAIPYFQLLCVVGLFYPIRVQNYNLFRIKRRSDIILKFGFVRHALTMIAFGLTYKHGILALIYGQIAVALFSQIIASYIASRLIKYDLMSEFLAIFKPTVISIIMGGVVFLGGKLNLESNLLTVVTQILIGGFIYFLINKITKSPELAEYLSIIQNLLNNLFRKLKGFLWKNR